MKIEDLEKLIAAASPRPWTCGYTPVTEHTHWQSHGPVTFGMKQAVSDATFIAACRDMVPKLLKVARAAMTHAGDEERYCGCPVCDLSDALSELEQE